MKQMQNEVIGLALICRENGIYKDLFELLRDTYIFRPVEKDKKKDAMEEEISNYTRALKWCIFFTIHFIIFQIVLFEPPRSNENYLHIFDGPPGPPGLRL